MLNECLNCKRIVVKETNKNRFPKMPKTCPWCSKPVGARQSQRKSVRSKRKGR